MRLLELLSALDADEVDRIAHAHGVFEEGMTREDILLAVESLLRSHRFVQDFIFNRQPPTFALMLLLLDAEQFSLPTNGFRDAVLAELNAMLNGVNSGTILRRQDQLKLYRRVLYQARSNDLHLDSSEAAILGVLRQELEIDQAEHFLVEHHEDFRVFWQQDEAFVRELHALRSAGLLFVADSMTVLAEDLVPVIRQVLGLDMSRWAARRLFNQLTGSELQESLSQLGAPTSGSKDEKVERLVAHLARPRSVLRGVGLETLRDICRASGAPVSGVKEHLIDRIVSRVASGRDIEKAPEPPVIEVREERALDEQRFALLFDSLRGHELGEMLAEFDLRRWGGKEVQIATAWNSHRSETTLLNVLSSGELESLLRRLELKTSGSKSERISRLIQHFACLAQSSVERALAHSPSYPFGKTRT